MLNRNANVSNHRKVGYAGQVGCTILDCNHKAGDGIRVSSKDANAELHFAATDIMFTNLMKAVKYRA